jgi:hypothetical protein
VSTSLRLDRRALRCVLLDRDGTLADAQGSQSAARRHFAGAAPDEVRMARALGVHGIGVSSQLPTREVCACVR